MFSVAVVCYRNFEYIYDALKSVMSQRGVDIELIVSDDGSQVFPCDRIAEYGKSHQGSNIKNVIIRSEEHNVGTVRHLNHIIDIASGDFICFLACDDVFAGDDTLKRYKDGFKKAGAECCIEMAQTAMYDTSLRHLDSYYLRPNIAKLLIDKDYDGLLKQLLIAPCLPTVSTCYKREFFIKYGKFDESYCLIEDLPMHLRIAAERIDIHYEKFVSIRHRHGGISHGASKAISETKRRYFRDCLTYVSQSEKYRLSLSGDFRKRIDSIKSIEKIYYEELLFRRSANIMDKIYFTSRHFVYTIWTSYVKLARLLPLRYPVKLFALLIAVMFVLPSAIRSVYLLSGVDLSDLMFSIYRCLSYMLIAMVMLSVILLPYCFVEKINTYINKYIYLRA